MITRKPMDVSNENGKLKTVGPYWKRRSILHVGENNASKKCPQNTQESAKKRHSEVSGVFQGVGSAPTGVSPMIRLAQSDRNDFGYPGRLHGNTVERIGDLHGLLVMGDHDKLRGS